MFTVAEAPMEAPETSEGKRLVDPHAQEWERLYATFTHLTLLLFHVAIPVAPAVVMWLIKREKSPFVDDHGREAINFQISLLLYYILGGLLVPACGLGLVLIIAAYALGIVGMILASVAANKGEYYRYPATVRFLH